MAELTHPMIVDGWFREINDQWPGEAHTLKVKKILHVEQSQYQVRFQGLGSARTSRRPH